MRLIRFFCVCLLSTWADTASAQVQISESASPVGPNHLVPVRGVYSHSPEGYRHGVAIRKLLGPANWQNALIQLVTVPGENGADFLAISNVVERNERGLESRSDKFEILYRYPSAPAYNAIESYSGAVSEKKRPISPKLTELLVGVWNRAIDDARHAEYSQGADGTSYYFTTLTKEARTWSPGQAQAIPHALIDLGNHLKKFAGGNPQITEKDLKNQCIELLKLMGASQERDVGR